MIEKPDSPKALTDIGMRIVGEDRESTWNEVLWMGWRQAIYDHV